jgi:hypothetical protein
VCLERETREGRDRDGVKEPAKLRRAPAEPPANPPARRRKPPPSSMRRRRYDTPVRFSGDVTGEWREVHSTPGCASTSRTQLWWRFSQKLDGGGDRSLRPFSGENSGEPGIGFLFDACVDRDDQPFLSKFRSNPSSGEFSGESDDLFRWDFMIYKLHLVSPFSFLSLLSKTRDSCHLSKFRPFLGFFRRRWGLEPPLGGGGNGGTAA